MSAEASTTADVPPAAPAEVLPTEPEVGDKRKADDAVDAVEEKK